MHDDLRILLEHPGLRRLAPQVAAAWADAVLTPAELARIERSARRTRGVSAADLVALRSWLDPQRPPTPRALARLEQSVSQERNAVVPNGERRLQPATHDVRDIATGRPISIRARALQRLLDGRHVELKADLRRVMASPEFALPASEDRHAYRAQVLHWLTRVGPLLMSRVPDGSNPAVAEFLAGFECLASHDLSLVVKLGVHYGLFCGALEQLGSAQHRPLLERARRLEVMGCFAMTERAHGSNVRDLLTRADYDPATGGFVLHTPSRAGGKEWIGNAAQHAHYAVVFAQLCVAGDCHGVHAFVVRLRNDDGSVCHGVRIEDCGLKMGLNGVDNGRLWFEHLHLPAQALLDRFGQVDGAGEYQSDIPSPSRRFFTMLGTLVRGRVAVAGAAISAAKTGLTVALRYAQHRRQLPSGGPERLLIAYAHHRRTLLPHLAAIYALSFAHQDLVQALVVSDTPAARRHVEERAAGLKAVASARAVAALQTARESCGGQGYLSENRIATLRSDAEVFTTFEGDNTVLLQLVAKAQLDAIAGKGITGTLSAVLASCRAELGVWAERHRPRAPLPVWLARNTPYSFPTLLGRLELRARALTTQLSIRLAIAVARGEEAQQAFDNAQNSAISCAKAQTEYEVARALVERAQRHAGLSALTELHLVSEVLAAAAWFAAEGVLTRNELRRLRARRRVLEVSVTAQLDDLLDAFAIPSASLGPLVDPIELARSGLAT